MNFRSAVKSLRRGRKSRSSRLLDPNLGPQMVPGLGPQIGTVGFYDPPPPFRHDADVLPSDFPRARPGWAGRIWSRLRMRSSA